MFIIFYLPRDQIFLQLLDTNLYMIFIIIIFIIITLFNSKVNKQSNFNQPSINRIIITKYHSNLLSKLSHKLSPNIIIRHNHMESTIEIIIKEYLLNNKKKISFECIF